MSTQRLVRLKAEMAMMAKNPAPGIHCWLKEETSDVILVEMEGPDGSPYEIGVFQLEVVLSDRYPFTPPNIRFITPVYHPNIDPNGRICLTALKPKPTGTWAVNLNIATVLSAIRILLAEPNLSDPLMTDIAKEYAEKYESYRKYAEAETMKHAKKVRGKPTSQTESQKRHKDGLMKTDEKENDSEGVAKSKKGEDVTECDGERGSTKKPRLDID